VCLIITSLMVPRAVYERERVVVLYFSTVDESAASCADVQESIVAGIGRHCSKKSSLERLEHSQNYYSMYIRSKK
jgi:hypothetical protein